MKIARLLYTENDSKVVFRLRWLCSKFFVFTCASRKISRQKHSFLLLEFVIALFLVGTCALPIAQFPLRAVYEEAKVVRRMHSQRLADVAFAKIQEMLYQQAIPWKTIASQKKDKAVIFEDNADVFLGPLGTKKFKTVAMIHSVGKRKDVTNEWRLATIRIEVTPEPRTANLFRSKKSSKPSRTYTYQVLVHKNAASAPPAANPPSTPS